MMDAKWIEKKMELYEEQIDNTIRELKRIEEELSQGITPIRMKQLYKDYTYFEELIRKLEDGRFIYKTILREGENKMKTKEKIAKENITIIRAMLKSEDVLHGGIDTELEEYYMNRYNRTQEEMNNLLLMAHAIIGNDEIKIEIEER